MTQAGGDRLVLFSRERVERYQQAVAGLIGDIRGWLQPWIDDGRVMPHPVREIEKFEQGHAYRVQSWSFNLGQHYVSIEPRGTWVIGAFGRADLVGQPGNSVALTLDDSFNWNLPRHGRTKITLLKLDETVFAEALRRALQVAR